MNRYFKRLAALISTSLAYNTQATVTTNHLEDTDENKDKSLSISILNQDVSTFLAAHRSHSSHSSHGSHRSSSGSSSSRSTPKPSAPVYRRAEPTPSIPKSDPIGQEPREPSSYPSAENSTALAEKLKNEEMRKNIIMRMQLTLQFEKYYDGEIDGIMGPKTRAAVLKYKKDKIGSTHPQVLDAETLNLFGISGF